ncbi:MAG TPA: class I SAM-dependent methyltransferase [candidate division Zixibacteria bacterium]|nr:class I SAM-dependent methyltransferase [candidate division Zixibacteria bacterium]
MQNGGEPALDVGCGTGRLLIPFLLDGLDVDGVDNSRKMLDICRQKARDQDLDPTLYQQSMEQLDLPREYGTIFIPSSTFQLITTPEDAFEAFLRFKYHVKSGGTLVMSIMSVRTAKQTEWRFLVEKERSEDKVTIRRWERLSFDEDSQLQSTENRFELVKDDQVISTELHVRSPATQNYSLDKITALFEKSGYSEVRALSTDTFEPASDSDSSFYILGTNK